MSKLLRDWFTGVDGVTYDLGRALWAAGVLVFLGATVYAIYRGQQWDAIAYGTGFGAVLAAGGAALWLKRGTDPTGDQK
jgi:hypothetical protein